MCCIIGGRSDLEVIDGSRQSPEFIVLADSYSLAQIGVRLAKVQVRGNRTGKVR